MHSTAPFSRSFCMVTPPPGAESTSRGRVTAQRKGKMTSMPSRSMPRPLWIDVFRHAHGKNGPSSDGSPSGRSRPAASAGRRPDESGHLGGDGTLRYQAAPRPVPASLGSPCNEAKTCPRTIPRLHMTASNLSWIWGNGTATAGSRRSESRPARLAFPKARLRCERAGYVPDVASSGVAVQRQAVR